MNKPLKIYKASAGSGKTFRLAVEYIKLLIENPMCYSNILAVTFTKKATAEMKMRILSQLYGIGHGLKESDNYFNEIKRDEHIQRLGLSDLQMRNNAMKALSAMMHDYSRFRIETIDSFFQSIVRQIAHELRLTNNLRLDLDSGEVLKEAVKALMNSLDQDKSLLRSVMRVVEEKMDDSKNWNIENEVLEFGKNIFNEQFLENKNSGGSTTRDDVEKFKTNLFALKETTLKLLCATGEEFLKVCWHDGLDATCFKGGNGNSGIYPFMEKTSRGELPNLSDSVMGFRNNPAAWPSKGHSDVEALAENTFVAMLNNVIEQRRLLNTIDVTAKHLNELMLINSIDTMVRQMNSDENRFLLADTAYMLQQLIQNQDIPFIYEKSGVRFTHIMIDEFQDTSVLQWKNFIPLLLNSMATDSQCLIVGDVKQSIYRWRNGDWSILNNLEKHPQFQQYALSTPMEDNHRSGGNVIHFNNDFFTAAAQVLERMFEEKTGLHDSTITEAYQSVKQREQERNKDKGYVRVELLDRSKQSESEDDEQESIDRTQEGRIIANVKMLRNQGVQPHDISILVRHKKDIPPICAAFAEQMPDVRIVSDEAFRLDSSPAVNFLIQALRLVASPDDRYLLSMLVYQYRTAVLHDTAYADINSIFLLNNEALRHLLPSEFQEHLETLAMKPLYELAEYIYDLFGLRTLQQQDSYLFSFFDELMNYLAERPSDLEHFLQFWDDSLCETTIPVGETDGIRILTIHKSKGLEFHTVIVPFCNWNFVNSSHLPLMWCKSERAPFNRIDLLPIEASEPCSKSFFAEDYNSEKLKTYVDNLNLLYVAFTRAKFNLVVLADQYNQPKNKSKSIPEKVNYVLQNSLPPMQEEEEGISTIHSLGEIVASPVKKMKNEEDEKEVNVLTQRPVEIPTAFLTQKVQATFRQSNRATQFAQGTPSDPSDDSQRYLNEGVLFHQLLSMLRTPDDLTAAIRRMDFEGYFSNERYRTEVMQLVQKALSQTQARQWFDPHWTVINECNIIYRDPDDGLVRTRRPDRVITDGRQTLVIDYKTGRQDADHAKQVRFYMERLTEMGYPNVCGFIWYIRRGDIVPV